MFLAETTSERASVDHRLDRVPGTHSRARNARSWRVSPQSARDQHSGSAGVDRRLDSSFVGVQRFRLLSLRSELDGVDRRRVA